MRGDTAPWMRCAAPSAPASAIIARTDLPEIGISLPNNQRQHRTLHIQKDVLPYALCQLLCPVSAALASIFRMDSISTSYTDLPHTAIQRDFLNTHE